MSGDVESGTCAVCSKEGPIDRKYYYYDIVCECCNNKDDEHFEIVYHCKDCKPKPPSNVNCIMQPIPDDEL